MKAMIFAAGMGSRLGKVTATIPKAMVEINGTTLLHNAVRICTDAGFDDIIVNVHHHAEMLFAEVDRLRGMGYRITISDERDQLLETGGGLYKARHFFDNEPFLIYNADIMTDMSIKELYKSHIKNTSLATLLVRNRPGNRFFLVDKEGILMGWRNKQTGEEILVKRNKLLKGTFSQENIVDEDEESIKANLSEIAFCGIHMVSPEIFQYMDEGKYSFTPLYLKLASEHYIRTVTCNDGYWFDIGTPEKIEEATLFFKNFEQQHQ